MTGQDWFDVLLMMVDGWASMDDVPRVYYNVHFAVFFVVDLPNS